MSVKAEWERILEAEGLGERLKQTSPRPRPDRDWSSHFPDRHAAGRDAIERLRLDAQSTADVFSLLADIRWGRHSDRIPPLTDEEREIFDPYCDGESFVKIGKRLGLSKFPVMQRFNAILARFTRSRPHLSRNHTVTSKK